MKLSLQTDNRDLRFAGNMQPVWGGEVVKMLETN